MRRRVASGVSPSSALQWLDRRGVDRAGVLCRQNHLLGPERLEFEDNHLVFYLENQGVYLWATAVGKKRDDSPGQPQLRLPFMGEDPCPAPKAPDEESLVSGRFNRENTPWELRKRRLSEFLIQMCLFEAIMRAKHRACASWANQQILDRVTLPLELVPLGAWRWPTYPHRFWAGGGAFVSACPNGTVDGELGYTILVGATDEEPLHYLKAIVDRCWERRTF